MRFKLPGFTTLAALTVFLLAARLRYADIQPAQCLCDQP